MTKNCWNSQALAEISCYLAFAGAMLYLVRSGRYLSYVTPKLAPYLCFSAAVMVVWALSSLWSAGWSYPARMCTGSENPAGTRVQENSRQRSLR